MSYSVQTIPAPLQKARGAEDLQGGHAGAPERSAWFRTDTADSRDVWVLFIAPFGPGGGETWCP